MCCGRGSSRTSATTSTPARPARVAQSAPELWTVTMPDASTRTVKNEIAAKLIVGATPGATYVRS
jgi:hypothetical protein